MTATAKKEEAVTVAEAARDAMNSAGGDVVKASRILEQRVRKDQKLRDELTEPLISKACYDAVRAHSIKERRQVWSTPAVAHVRPENQPVAPNSNLTQSGRVVALAKGTMLMFPLPGGKPLGEAGRDDLVKAESFYASQSADMSAKARWLQLVMQSLPAGKKVGDVMTDKRLRELQAEALKNAA